MATPETEVTEYTPEIIGGCYIYGLKTHYEKDEKGNFMYKKDENGNDITDEKGYRIKIESNTMGTYIAGMILMLKENDKISYLFTKSFNYGGETPFSRLLSRDSIKQYYNNIQQGIKTKATYDEIITKSHNQIVIQDKIHLIDDIQSAMNGGDWHIFQSHKDKYQNALNEIGDLIGNLNDKYVEWDNSADIAEKKRLETEIRRIITELKKQESNMATIPEHVMRTFVSPLTIVYSLTSKIFKKFI